MSPIINRKLDLLYLIFFLVGIPAIFLLDLQTFYPAHLIPQFMLSLKSYYITTYKDLFFMNIPGNTHFEPPFLRMFIWSELLFQAPAMIWGVYGLWTDHPKTPLVLLPYACLIFISTAACMVEMLCWDVPSQQKVDLSTLYGPYLALSAVMGIDMYSRLNGLIDHVEKEAKLKLQ